MKQLDSFSSSDACKSIQALLSPCRYAMSQYISDVAFESDHSFYFSRIANVPMYDNDSVWEIGVSDFCNRSLHTKVCVMPGKNKFRGTLNDVAQLVAEGYDVYALGLHASGFALRGNNSLKVDDLKDFAASEAFLAIPANSSLPSVEFLDEFSRWNNEHAFSFECFQAVFLGVDADGESRFNVDKIDDDSDSFTQFFSRKSVEHAAFLFLDATVKHRA